MYNIIKGVKVNYDDQTPFIMETVAEDKSVELTDDQEAIVKIEIDRRIKAIEKEAKLHVSTMISQAKSEAENLLEDARREAALIYETRHKEGYEQGTLEAAEKYSVIIENSNDLIKREEERFENEIAKFSDDVLDVSIAMAKKIMNIEFERNDTAILEALSKLIEEYKNEKNLIIEVSAKNLERLKETELARKYEIRENKTLGEKDAQIELDSGIIDISMDKQLENLEKIMREV